MAERVYVGAGSVVAGVAIPDTTMAREAIEYAREVSSPMLFNHVMRSYLFGRLAAAGSAGPVDEETVLLSAVLHDLGLTDAARGGRRFEIEGADAARAFLRERGCDDRLSWLVWDTIALHPWGDINLFKEPEARVVQVGIMADAVGVGVAAVDPTFLTEILRAFPRLGFKAGFHELLRLEAEAKPGAHIVHPVHMVAERCCAHVPIPDARAMLDAAPFDS